MQVNRQAESVDKKIAGLETELKEFTVRISIYIFQNIRVQN